MDEQQDGITAYHGSPHDFERFDTSKIGTGEGAQAYGHGLYFAEHEPVAKGYRDRISSNKDQVDLVHKSTGEKIDENTPGYAPTRQFFSTYRGAVRQGDITHAKEQWKNRLKSIDPEIDEVSEFLNDPSHDEDTRSYFNSRLEKLHKEKIDKTHAINLVDKVDAAPVGHMYEVHINAHPHHFLDWDKPFNQQSEHVQNALMNALQASFDHSPDAGDLYRSTKFNKKDRTYKGEDFYNAIKPVWGDKTEISKIASDILRQHGIKGIKYLDAGSRGNKAEPTHNYVVFDHNDVRVKRKYEQGGAVESFAEGGGIWDDSQVRRTGEGGTETALDFVQNAPLYKQRIEAQGSTPPATAPVAKEKTMPVTEGPPPTPPAIVQTAPAPVQQTQPQTGEKVGLYHIGTNDIKPEMTVQSAQRIIEASRAMGISPVFMLPNQTARGKFNNPYYKGDDYLRVANNSYALQKYLDDNGIQYVMPEYNNKKDAYHMDPDWIKNFAKSYNSPFIAGDSNAVRLNILGYKAKVPDGKTLTEPKSGANLSWGAQTSKTIADELEKYLKWQQQQRKSGGRVHYSANPTIIQKALELSSKDRTGR